jgi:hypothetical protein
MQFSSSLYQYSMILNEKQAFWRISVYYHNQKRPGIIPAFLVSSPAMRFCIAPQDDGVLCNFRLAIDLGICMFPPRPVVMEQLGMRIQLVFVAHTITSWKDLDTADIHTEYQF